MLLANAGDNPCGMSESPLHGNHNAAPAEGLAQAQARAIMMPLRLPHLILIAAVLIQIVAPRRSGYAVGQ